MTTDRRLAPPSGGSAPIDVLAPDGRIVDVRDLAREVCRRYRAELPDEEERYGETGHLRCVHDVAADVIAAAGHPWSDDVSARLRAATEAVG